MKKYFLYFIFICSPLIFAFFGYETLPFESVWRQDSPGFPVYWNWRMIRLCSAFIIGASLSVIGLVYQIIFLNPLVEPYALGVSSFVILLSLVVNLVFGIVIQGFWGVLIGLLVASLLVFCMRTKTLVGNSETLLLKGMTFNFFISSCLFTIQAWLFHSNQGFNLTWLFGELGWPTLQDFFKLFLVAFLGMLFIWSKDSKLSKMFLGDEVALTLGVNSSTVRKQLLVVTTIWTAVLVLQVGSIGFVGLMIPQWVRKWKGTTLGKDMWVCTALFGGFYLTLGDVISRSVVPGVEFPVGVITSLMGGLFLVVNLGKLK